MDRNSHTLPWALCRPRHPLSPPPPLIQPHLFPACPEASFPLSHTALPKEGHVCVHGQHQCVHYAPVCVHTKTYANSTRGGGGWDLSCIESLHPNGTRRSPRWCGQQRLSCPEAPASMPSDPPWPNPTEPELTETRTARLFSTWPQGSQREEMSFLSLRSVHSDGRAQISTWIHQVACDTL